MSRSLDLYLDTTPLDAPIISAISACLKPLDSIYPCHMEAI